MIKEDIMSDNFDYDKIRREAKRAERFGKIKEKLEDAGRWIGEHKKEIAWVSFFVLAGSKQANRMIESHRQEVNRTLRVWDPKEGHYWNIRRKLTTDEFLDMEALEKRGYSKGEALRQMGLLKKR